MAKRNDGGGVASRTYWREDEARAVVAAWRASGESLSAFARRRGVERRRIARWLGRLETAPAMQFHPVRVAGIVDATASPAAIEIELPSGERIRLRRGFDADDLRCVFALLGATSSC